MKPIYSQLPVIEIDAPENIKRVLFYSPETAYENYTSLDIFKRINPRRLEQAFPIRNDGYCSCGCGNKLTGRKKRWHSKQCTEFALDVTDIIAGISKTIKYYLAHYHSNGEVFCTKCGCEEGCKVNKSWISVSDIHVDHIVPVHKGGGGCWLNNYQLLCESCHKEKTKSDRLI